MVGAVAGAATWDSSDAGTASIDLAFALNLPAEAQITSVAVTVRHQIGYAYGNSPVVTCTVGLLDYAAPVGSAQSLPWSTSLANTTRTFTSGLPSAAGLRVRLAANLADPRASEVSWDLDWVSVNVSYADPLAGSSASTSAGAGVLRLTAWASGASASASSMSGVGGVRVDLAGGVSASASCVEGAIGRQRLILTDPALVDSLGRDRTVDLLVELLDEAMRPVPGAVGVDVGPVSCDSTSLAWWSASFATCDPSWIPVRPSDPLHPLAHGWLRILWVASLPGGQLRLPLATLRIGEGRHIDTGVPGYSGALVDPLIQVRAARWAGEGLSLGGMPAVDAVSAILRDRAPWLHQRVVPGGGTLPDGYRVGEPDRDPMEDVRAIVDAHGLSVYTDPHGVVQIGPLAVRWAPEAAWRHGEECRVESWQVDTPAELLRNRVMIYSTAASVNPPVAGLAEDHSGGPLDVSRGVLYSEAHGVAEIINAEQAQAMAARRLAAGQSARRVIQVDAIADPRLLPGAVIAVSNPGIGLDSTAVVTRRVMSASGARMTVTAVERVL